MFRSSTIIRELALNLAKSYIYVKTFGEITSLCLYAVVWQHAATQQHTDIRTF